MHKLALVVLTICGAFLLSGSATAQQNPPPALPQPVILPPYGAPITFEQAKKIATVAEAEIKKQPVPLAIAIVEPSGALVYYFRLDGTNYLSLEIAVRKARSAAMYRQPTASFANIVAGNSAAAIPLVSLHPATVVNPGGVLIMDNGKIIGALGISGFHAGVLDHAMAEQILAAAR